MRFSTSSSLLFLALSSTEAFIPPSVPTSLASSSALFVTAEQAADRARAAADMALKPTPQPKLFDDDLLTDMQECLLKLEKRVNEGPGALSMLEVEELGFASQRILTEMKLNEHNRPKPAPAFPDGVPPSSAAAAAQPDAPAAPVAAAPEPVVQAQVQTNKPKVMDTSMDEGPAYEGVGGMGLAKGTTNTYVIPGMDEMSPEEYQKALQKSISDRQARRVEAGTYGNVNSNSYLDNLGGGGGD